LHFSPRPAWTTILLFMLPTQVAGITNCLLFIIKFHF
jgi:hypothetical protein